MAKYEEHNELLSHLDKLKDIYNAPMERLSGLYRNPKDIIRTIEFYSNNQYLSGNTDSIGREKPFYNVCNYRVTTAKTATDLDVKDIRFEPDSLKFSVQAMMYNKELYKFLKDSNFSKTLNDMGKTRPKYGGLLVKKHEHDGELDIEVVDWVNLDFNPTNIIDNIICETHYMSPSEFSAKDDVWYKVEEVLKLYAKQSKEKQSNIEIKEYHGDFPESFYPDNEGGSDYKYARMSFKVACVGNKKCLVDYSYEKDNDYKYLAWEEVGKSLGRGVVEEGFESQAWTNDAVITMKNALELASKVILYTDSQKISGNAITGVDHGHIFQMQKGDQLGQLNLGANSMPQYENLIGLWDTQYNKVSSTFDANTGEAPTSGTPYSQTALLNQVANSPFEYQREIWGIFLNEILNDWVKPHLKKKIMKKHYLVSEFDDKELKMIDESISEFEAKKMLKEALLKGKTMSRQEYLEAKEAIMGAFADIGSKREMDIPQGYLDIEGNITANITGELKNKGAILQSLDNIMRTIVSSFNPNTGQFGVLQDPILNEIMGQIVELSGVPLSFGQIKATNTKAVQLADPTMMSAGQPAQPITA